MVSNVFHRALRAGLDEIMRRGRIRERRQMRELAELHGSERNYRPLLENMLDGYAYCQMLFDDEGRPVDFVYLNVNDAFARLTGLENVVGKKATEAIPGIREAHPELLETYGRVATTGRTERFEIEFKPLGIWLSIAVYSTRKGYFTTIFDNITERKQAEAELARHRERLEELVQERTSQLETANEKLREREQTLEESEERLAVALRGTRMGMYHRNLATGENLCTERFIQLVGLRKTTMTTTTTLSQSYLYHEWAERVHPEDLPHAEAQLRGCMIEGTLCEIEYRVIWPDGSVHWVADRVVWRYDPDCREPTHILGILMEITERKHAEQALRESEQQFKSTFENAAIGIAHVALDGHILQVNRRFCEIAGYPCADILGKTCEQITFADDWQAERAQMQRLLDGAVDHYAIEKHYLRTDGSPVWVNLTRSIQRDDTGKPEYFIVLVEDISARKRAEDALRELTATLESKVALRTAELGRRTIQLQKLTLDMSEAEDRERQRLAEILHDDLQQVLAAAKFQLGLLSSRVRDDASLQAPAAQIDQMLKDAIGKSRSLSHELSPAVLHHDDFAETLRWLASQVQAKHGLVVHVHAHGPVRLPSDAIKAFLYRTAQEMLFNVVKHARVNEAQIRVRPCGRYICLSVSDRGRGFDPQELGEATGFGLLSIRERIELLGGCMKIKSAQGKGSRFFVAVPAGETAGTGSEADAGSEGRAKEAGRGASEESSRLRVLLADDHKIVRQGLVALLSEEQTVEIVGEAANGREAVDLADRLEPDVIIMDVSMPVIDGDEATRQIKTLLPKTRVIALSMYDEPETMENMYRAGAESYVLKTASCEELLAALLGKESDS